MNSGGREAWGKLWSKWLAGGDDKLKPHFDATQWRNVVSDLKAMTREEQMRFFATFYTPGGVETFRKQPESIKQVWLAKSLLMQRILYAAMTGNGQYFRNLADEFEKPERPICRRRYWLIGKHEPRVDGTVPAFTHAELLDDAEKRGITTSDRQLRRDMTELGFKFKNSRR